MEEHPCSERDSYWLYLCPISAPHTPVISRGNVVVGYLPILVVFACGTASEIRNCALSLVVHFSAVVSAMIFRAWFRQIGMRARGWQLPLHRSPAAQLYSPVFPEAGCCRVLRFDNLLQSCNVFCHFTTCFYPIKISLLIFNAF
jgi:hypothetical protein